MNQLTPNDVEVLLHCHCCPQPHPRNHASDVQEALDALQFCGAIAPLAEGSQIRMTTPLGSAWVKAICQTPIPTLAYINAQGEVIQ